MRSFSDAAAAPSDLDRAKDLFFQLLEAERDSPGFPALFEECHRLIGLAMEEGASAPGSGSSVAGEGAECRSRSAAGIREPHRMRRRLLTGRPPL